MVNLVAGSRNVSVNRLTNAKGSKAGRRISRYSRFCRLLLFEIEFRTFPDSLEIGIQCFATRVGREFLHQRRVDVLADESHGAVSYQHLNTSRY